MPCRPFLKRTCDYKIILTVILLPLSQPQKVRLKYTKCKTKKKDLLSRDLLPYLSVDKRLGPGEPPDLLDLAHDGAHVHVDVELVPEQTLPLPRQRQVLHPEMTHPPDLPSLTLGVIPETLPKTDLLRPHVTEPIVGLVLRRGGRVVDVVDVLAGVLDEVAAVEEDGAVLLDLGGVGVLGLGLLPAADPLVLAVASLAEGAAWGQMRCESGMKQ